MRETLKALSAILQEERGVSAETVSKASYKVSVEFLKKDKTAANRKLFLRRVIEESLR